MAGVQKMQLKNLQSNSQNTVIIGVVINSMNPKNFEPCNQKYGHGGMRGVWTFTLRDSPEDNINVTVWGGVEFIDRYFNSFRIGQVVEVINGKVVERKPDSTNEMYVPNVTSPYSIVINEGAALIQIHDSPACAKYQNLIRVTAKPVSEVKPINAILSQIDELQNRFFNLFVIVTFIGQEQDIVSKDGRKCCYRIFEVRDASTEESVQLRLWEKEWIRLSEVWEPNRTALFIANAKVIYDNFKKKTVLTIDRKSIITEDPDIAEVFILRNAVRNISNSASSTDPFTLPNPKSITTVMTIYEITEKLNEALISNNSNRLQLLTLVYAQIIDINLDDDIDNIVYTKCALCKRIVLKDNDSCMTLECPSGNGSRRPMNLISLGLKVHLKDHTGYLVGCRLVGSAAETAIGKSATEIQVMTNEERSNLRWNFINQNFEVRLQVIGPTANYTRAIYNILSLEQSDSQFDLEDFLAE